MLVSTCSAVAPMRNHFTGSHAPRSSQPVPVEEVGPHDGVVGVLPAVVHAEGEPGELEEKAAVERVDPAVVPAALVAGQDDLGRVVLDVDVRLVLG